MASISRARKASAAGMIPQSTPQTVAQSIPHMDALLLHGGDLGAARRLFPSAPEPFIDLSTGINPHSYPVPPLSSDVFGRLPQSAALNRLVTTAAEDYRAPTPQHV